jgi:hypothetical protein
VGVIGCQRKCSQSFLKIQNNRHREKRIYGLGSSGLSSPVNSHSLVDDLVTNRPDEGESNRPRPDSGNHTRHPAMIDWIVEDRGGGGKSDCQVGKILESESQPVSSLGDSALKGQFASPDYDSSCIWWRGISSEIQSEGPCHFGSSISSSNPTMPDREQREFRSIMLKGGRRFDGSRKFQQLTMVSGGGGGFV